jgi:hypothetical protein
MELAADARGTGNIVYSLLEARPMNNTPGFLVYKALVASLLPRDSQTPHDRSRHGTF